MTNFGLRRLVVLLTVIFTVYFVCGLIGGYFHNQNVLNRYAEVQRTYAENLRLNKELKAKLIQVQEDDFIELTARDKLGLVKPGEIAYKIIEED